MPTVITPEARDLMQRMQAAYDGLRSLAVSGKCIGEDLFVNKTRSVHTASFSIYFKAPAMYRYDLGDRFCEEPRPGGRLGEGTELSVRHERVVFVSNGRMALSYNLMKQPPGHPEINSYWQSAAPPGRKIAWRRYKKPLENLPSPLRHVDSVVGLVAYKDGVQWVVRRAIRIERGEDSVIDGRPYAMLRMRDRAGEIMAAYVDPQTYHLRRYVEVPLPDPSANKTSLFTWDYITTDIDVPVEDDLFEWAPPRGAMREE